MVTNYHAISHCAWPNFLAPGNSKLKSFSPLRKYYSIQRRYTRRYIPFSIARLFNRNATGSQGVLSSFTARKILRTVSTGIRIKDMFFSIFDRTLRAGFQGSALGVLRLIQRFSTMFTTHPYDLLNKIQLYFLFENK